MSLDTIAPFQLFSGHAFGVLSTVPTRKGLQHWTTGQTTVQLPDSTVSPHVATFGYVATSS